MPRARTELSRSVSDTENIAAALVKAFVGGECVALHGDLGAGKTQFVRGVVRGLGGNPRAVSSPTFVLLNIYDLPTGAVRRVFHLDAYRVQSDEDFESIGFAELLEQPDAIVIVEWPERVESLLPAGTRHIHIAPDDSGVPTHRLIRISEHGEQSPCS